MNTKNLFILFAAAAVSACTSNIQVHQIPSLQRGGEKVVGVPFRVPSNTTIRVYKRNNDGGYEEVYNQQFVLPDPDRLFGVSFTAKQLADNSLILALRDSGIASNISLTQSQKADEALAAFTSKGLDAVTALTTIDEQRKAKELSLLTTQNQLDAALATRTAAQETTVVNREAALEAALAAISAADSAALALDQLPVTATEVERAAAKANLRILRLRANHAYRKAGLPEPFSDVFP